MTVTTNRASIGDMDSLIHLMRQFYKESGFELNERLSRQAFDELIGNPALGGVWLMYENETRAGYIVLTYGFSMAYGGRDAYVEDLYVLPEFRDRGVGRCGIHTLFEACRAQGIRAVHVDVGTDNTPAIGLYTAFGFKKQGHLFLTCTLSDENTAIESRP
ncbi:MAG: GNAT family N-acetyltransferase [Desulfobacteraceae bacterium]|nr:GNAT family N-acetyltransferase [Desulfobacteraceae bacterium]